MNKAKRLRLEAKGWKVGTVEEFLELTPEESAYIELKLKLADGLVQRRQEKELTQIQLAKKEKNLNYQLQAILDERLNFFLNEEEESKRER